jgi:hypothetical protein
MNKELANEQVCIITSNRAEIWIDKSRLGDLLRKIDGGSNLIEIDGNYINPKNIEILTAQEMDDIIRRKNGQWQCKYSKWHERAKKCECRIDNLTGENLAQYCQS